MRTGLIQVGDIIAEIGGQSVRGLPFDRVTAVLGASWTRGAAIDLGPSFFPCDNLSFRGLVAAFRSRTATSALASDSSNVLSVLFLMKR